MNNINLLPKIIKLPSGKDVIKELESVLRKTYKDNYVTDYDNYIYFENTKSSSLLQAHVDTVKRADKIELYTRNGILFSEGVLGADDRAGVWAIIKLIEFCRDGGKIEIPNALFTNYEESGSGGMKMFTKTFKKDMFDSINMAIALDRRGCGHYVSYNHLQKEVEIYMASFGWADQTGSFSDISIFTDEYLIPSVNLSIGYHSEHTKNETLNIDELYMTMGRVERMLGKPIKERYESKKKYTYVWEGRDYWKDKNKKDEEEKLKEYVSMRYTSYCDFCNGHGKVNYIPRLKQALCDKCYDDWVLTMKS